MIQKNDYGLVLSDISLPGLSGIELYQKARMDNPDLAFVFISGYPMKKEWVHLIESSGGFLQKPFGLDELEECLQRILKPEG